MYKLVALSGEDHGREWELESGRSVIGRAAEATVQLHDTKASRLHCVIEVGDATFIEDLGSLNLTYVNGTQVTRSRPLAPGDRITVGDTELGLVSSDADAPLSLLVTTALQGEIRAHKLRDFEREFLAHGLVGRSAGIRKVLETVSKIAPTEVTILISGPSGTGKELVACAIHYNSPRKDGNFVAVNCAALPESLLESELFGYEKGAFTGATGARAGKFQYANGGTMFLDEIGDMPLSCQAKLLRVLQDKTYTRLGSNQVEKADCRIIAATNKDLEKAVEQKTFREDLFYRVNVINIAIPPLSERREDIELLAGHFLEKFCSVHGLPQKSLSAEALESLRAHDWPGNVRELQNCIERAVLLTDARVVAPDDLRLDPRQQRPVSEEAAFVPRALREIERQHILRVLEHTGGNKKRAAEILGIERNTLYERLRQYGLHE